MSLSACTATRLFHSSLQHDFTRSLWSLRSRLRGSGLKLLCASLAVFPLSLLPQIFAVEWKPSVFFQIAGGKLKAPKHIRYSAIVRYVVRRRWKLRQTRTVHLTASDCAL
jgi:hypothetical protein